MAEYDELKVRIYPDPSGGLRILASGPGGEASRAFELPFSDDQLENFVLKVGRARRGVRGRAAGQTAKAMQFGKGLFNAVFHESIRDLYRDSSASAREAGKGLRVTLHLTEAPKLMHVPWEFMFDDPDFLSLRVKTPIVRYLDLRGTRRALRVQPPLRILGMISSPRGPAQLDVEGEQHNVEEALKELTDRGLIELKWLEQATLRALQRELRRAEYHVFHYIGHGTYDERAEDGLLVLEDADGNAREISGWELGTILCEEDTLRLAVLNACEGARTSADDPFAGVAASLVQREVPAVIAMQFEITDEAAIVFSEELYSALVDDYPIDAALAEARKAIFRENSSDVEWGTPVLFMRVPDGRIFDVASGKEAVPPPQSDSMRMSRAESNLRNTPEEARPAEPSEPAQLSTAAAIKSAKPEPKAEPHAAPPRQQKPPKTEPQAAPPRQQKPQKSQPEPSAGTKKSSAASKTQRPGQGAKSQQKRKPSPQLMRASALESLARRKLVSPGTQHWHGKDIDKLIKETGLLIEHLRPGEEVVNLAVALHGQHDFLTGMVAVTDNRLVYVYKGPLGKREFVDLPFSRITKIEKKGLIWLSLVVTTVRPNATTTFKQILPMARADEIIDYVKVGQRKAKQKTD